MTTDQPPKPFQADIDCRRINDPIRRRDSGQQTVHRAEVDCRRLHQPIRFPDSNLRNVVEIQREVVPIIFIPGIMGSRLRDRKGKKVWDPDSKIFMLGKFGLLWQNAKRK